MGVEIDDSLLLLHRLHLQVQSWRIYVCSDEVDSLPDVLFADYEEGRGLIMIDCVDTVSCFQSPEFCNVPEACLLSQLKGCCDAFAFCLAVIEKCLVCVD